MECGHSDSVRQKMKKCKFRSGADWQGVSKQKGVKMDVKQRLGELCNKYLYIFHLVLG